MNKTAWSSALLATLLLVGCGSGSSSDETTNSSSSMSESTTSSSSTTPIQKSGVGYYVDDAVEGVMYRCGAYEGNTTEDGAFTFEKGEDCAFYLGDLTLREVNGSILSEDNLTIIEDNETVAQMLQSFDRDGNATNGIQLNSGLIKEILKENNIDQIPEDEALLKMVVDELKVKDANFTGDLVSEEEAQAHLERTKDRLDAEGRRTQHDVNTTEIEHNDFFDENGSEATHFGDFDRRDTNENNLSDREDHWMDDDAQEGNMTRSTIEEQQHEMTQDQEDANLTHDEMPLTHTQEEPLSSLNTSATETQDAHEEERDREDLRDTFHR